MLEFDVSSISNGMAASHVLGQADFTSSNAALGSQQLNSPTALSLDSTHHRLYVVDRGNNRVLQYDSSAIADFMAASRVIGQANMNASVQVTTQAGMWTPAGVVADASANRLYVSDLANNRVLAYDSSLLSDGMAASYVLGQTLFTTNGGGTASDMLAGPGQLGVDEMHGKLYVSDFYNSRVAVFDTSGLTNGKAASSVIGQSTFTDSSGATSQSRLNMLEAVTFGALKQKLYLADSSNNRVLVFDSATQQASATVNAVIEPQLTFASSGYNGGLCNGAAINATASTATTVGLFPTLAANGIGGQTFQMSTNAEFGYTLYARYSGALSDGNGHLIADTGGSNAVPVAPSSAGTTAFGYTTDHNLSGSATRFQSNKWAAFTTSAAEVAYVSNGPLANDTTHVCEQAGIDDSVVAATFLTSVIFTAVPSF